MYVQVPDLHRHIKQVSHDCVGLYTQGSRAGGDLKMGL